MDGRRSPAHPASSLREYSERGPGALEFPSGELRSKPVGVRGREGSVASLRPTAPAGLRPPGRAYTILLFCVVLLHA